MKTHILILINLLSVILLIDFINKDNQNTVINKVQGASFNKKSINENESYITINDKKYNLSADPCILQTNDNLNILTFKAVNNDIDYSLTVNLGAFNGNVNTGNYIYSNGENQVNFVVITFVTEKGTFVNGPNSVVAYTKNGNKGHVSATNMSLIDSYETLPNITISFNIYCSME
ncbi:hypothetical protein [Flavobacterium polysaccharolyticum]|uniref:Uncharacterized protein n=1 Tax=Flavobacterium polysaccharolyticum TaxID=3133148 RepID=A0ABU9NJW1_9FLAO